MGGGGAGGGHDDPRFVDAAGTVQGSRAFSVGFFPEPEVDLSQN